MDVMSLITGMVDGLPIDVMGLSPSEQRDLILKTSGGDFANLDLIWTQTGVDCCMAVASGWSYGFRSSEDSCWAGKKSGRHYPLFIDNHYENYNHQHHLRVIKKYRPKYATVRDMMTPAQCNEAGITYYSPTKIVEWAEQLAEYAEKVMIIPKDERYLEYIDPNNFMIGYSVLSSYGGTPVPIEKFSDYKIHLLGGSINKQIALWSQMPDNVISLDNNSLHLASCKGQAWLRNGSMVALQDFRVFGENWGIEDLGFGDLINVQKVCIAISLGNVGSYFKKQGMVKNG